MNSSYRKNLKKLSEEIKEVGKRLEGVTKIVVKPVTPSIQKQKRIHAENGAMAEKPSSKPSKSTMKKYCKHVNPKLSSVEVTLKTKDPDKYKKKNTKKYTVSVPHNATLTKKSKAAVRNEDHCRCLPSPKVSNNIIWGNILKNSDTNSPRSTVLQPEKPIAENSMKAAIEQTATKNRNCNLKDVLQYRYNTRYGHSRTSPNPCTFHDLEMFNAEPLSRCCLSVKSSQEKPSSCCCGKEPHNIYEDGSTQKLVREMQTALEKMSRAPTPVSRSSSRSKLSSRKSVRGTAETASNPKVNVETQTCVSNLSARKSNDILKDKLYLNNENPSYEIELEGESKFKKEHTKEMSKNEEYTVPPRIHPPLNECSPRTTLKDNKDTQINFYVDQDEKMKTEIDSIKKQMNFQLRTVDTVSVKETECQHLMKNLIDKVKNLEDQINEQKKASQNFLAQNSLQNTLIPALEASREILSKKLQETLSNYEKLKVDYLMLKVEKEKYLVLNKEKDKEMRKFKEEIMNIHLLVEEQMKYLKNFEGFTVASDKVDSIINAIDSQSNMIKSRLENTKMGAPSSTSPPSSPSSFTFSSPTSASPLTTPRESALKTPYSIPKQQSENTLKDVLNDFQTIRIPELQSPKPA